MLSQENQGNTEVQIGDSNIFNKRLHYRGSEGLSQGDYSSKRKKSSGFYSKFFFIVKVFQSLAKQISLKGLGQTQVQEFLSLG